MRCVTSCARTCAACARDINAWGLVIDVCPNRPVGESGDPLVARSFGWSKSETSEMSSTDAGRAVVVVVEAKRRGLRAQRQRVELVNDLDDDRVPFFAALAALASINTALTRNQKTGLRNCYVQY